MIYSLTGADQVILNDIPVKDFANGDIGTLEVPNDLFTMTTGKDGNTIFALNEAGNNATLTLRLMISSLDDKRLNGLIPKSGDFASTILVNGSVIKAVGDGKGNLSSNVFMLQGGMIQRIPATKINVDGDTDQAIVEYVIPFANVTRSIV